MKNSLLHVVTCISNPLRLKSRIENARKAITEWVQDGANVYLVECATGERDWELADIPGIVHIPVRSYTLAWNKESLINIAINRLPHDAKYIMLADADIHFRKRNWAAETVHALQLYPVVQPWHTAIDLGPNDETVQVHRSFCSLYHEGKPVIPNGPKFWKFNGGPYDYSHCLPGDTLVIPGGGINAASARPFKGNLVVIRTASGQELSCSPNHPILSNGAWVRAENLNVGDNVFRHVRGNGIAGKPYEKHTPTRIEDVVCSFRERTGMHRTTNLLPDDFDGNFANSKVTEIWSNRNLTSKPNAEAIELIRDLCLSGITSLQSVFSFINGFNPSNFSTFASASANCSNFSSALGSHIGKHSSTNSVGDFLSSLFSSFVPSSFSSNTHSLDFNSLSSRVARIRADYPVSSIETHADNPSGLLHTLSTQIESDKIIFVGSRYYDGHLYDLRTNNGYILANTLLTHNTGFLWSFTRKFLEEVGLLLDICGMGSADHHMAYAMIGQVEKSLPGNCAPSYVQALKLWESRAVRSANYSLGFVPQTVEHYFHGRKQDRGYQSRWEMFLKHNFDPVTDLKRNSYGVLEFSGRQWLL